MKKILFLYLFITCFCFRLKANNYNFRHLDGRSGLVNNMINGICRDHVGYMWFATGGGLCRYDGYSFRTIGVAEGMMLDNKLISVQELADGRLLISDANLYCLFNPKTERFSQFSELLDVFDVKGYAFKIHVDRNKNLWCYVMGHGVYYCDVKTGKKTTFSMNGDNPALPMGQISAICESKNGVLVVYNDATLASINGKTAKVLWHHNRLLDLGASPRNQYNVFEDSGENVWVFSARQVFIYSKQHRRWFSSVADFCQAKGLKFDKRFADSAVCSAVEDASGNVWLGTDHSNLFKIDYKHGETLLVPLYEESKNISATNPVSTLFFDKQNSFLWVGTYKNGISYTCRNLYKFGFVGIEDVNTMVQDKAGNYWYGTNGNGIIFYDKKNGIEKRFNKQNCKQLLSDIFVSSLVARNGDVWFGSYWGGLYRFGKDGGITAYRNDSSNPNTLANDNVWSLAEDGKGNIWIATLGGGLQKFDVSANTFTTFNSANCGILSDYLSSVVVDGSGNIVLGGSKGISVINGLDYHINNYVGTIHHDKQFSKGNVNQVFVDSRGLYWIATDNGLNIFNARDDELDILDESTGLASSVICGIAEDRQHNIWITTSKGLSNIVIDSDSKKKFKVYNYYEYDGLVGLDYNLRSILMTHSGEIQIGCTAGINDFNPQNVIKHKKLPKVLFSQIQLFNKNVVVGEKYDGRVVMKTAVANNGIIELNYDQNVLSVALGLDDYRFTEKTRFKYQLEGFNDNWLFTDANQHVLTFTGLESGTYKLRVKCVNGDYESDVESVLTIVVHPPFWRTPWAYILYAVLLGCFYWYHHNRTIRRQKEKLRIEQIKREAEKDHEVDEMKLRFFTNVSHELRTPLTLIITPIANLLSNETDAAKKKTLSMVHNNAVKLLTLVNQLLDFRKSDMSSFKLNRINGDIVSFIQNITNSFSELLDRKFCITFYSSQPSFYMMFDEDKMGKIVMNLLSNSCKFTPEGGRIDVSLQVLERENSQQIFEIRVADTGVGIKDEDKTRIFERFYQTETEGVTDVCGGSGIGLSLVKEFVSLHEGTVKVVDNVGGGSVFIVDIPVVLEKKIPASETRKTVAKECSKLIVEKDDMVITGQKNAPLVMIVDDSKDFLDFMEECFSSKYQVVCARNGEQAWKFLQMCMPDIILSDVMMPLLDGNGLCKRVKEDERFRHIPFFMLTARLAEEHKVEGLRSGADDYITKPFNLDMLMLKVERIVEKSGSHEETQNREPEVESAEAETTRQYSVRDEKLVERATFYINENISKIDLTVEELSESLGISRVHLYKKILCVTGMTPLELIRALRVERGKHLLRDSQLNVSEVAYMVGFNSPRYFSKYFKDMYGMLPSEYQKNHCTK